MLPNDASDVISHFVVGDNYERLGNLTVNRGIKPLPGEKTPTFVTEEMRFFAI